MNKYERAIIRAQRAPSLAMPSVPHLEGHYRVKRHLCRSPIFIGAAAAVIVATVSIVGIRMSFANGSSQNKVFKAMLANKTFSEQITVSENIKDVLYNEILDYDLSSEGGVFSPVTSFLVKAPYLLASSEGTEAVSELGLDSDEYRSGISSLRSSLYRQEDRSFIHNALAVGAFDIPVQQKAAMDFAEKENLSFVVAKKDIASQTITDILSDECKEDINIPSSFFEDLSIATFSYLSIQDLFPSARETIRGNFFGKEIYEASFVEDHVRASHLTGATFQAMEYKVGKTSLTFFLPNEEVEASTIDVDSILKQWRFANKNKKNIHLIAPIFEVEETKEKTANVLYGHMLEHPFDLLLPGHASAANWSSKISFANHFRFDESGVYGSSLAAMNSTLTSSTSPGEEIEFVIDRPFLFLSCFEDIPLFFGSVQTPMK